MSTQPNALRLADWIADQWVYEKLDLMTQEQVSEVIEELRAQHELIQTLKAAIKTGVDLVHSDVIRVRPSERQKLIDALTDWHSALAAAGAHK